MMIFDRQKQRLLLEGKEYTPGDIHSLVAEGEGNHPSAIWDLYLFLNEWFNDDPVITVHTSGSTGAPKELLVRKDQMIQSARLTCEFLDLKQGETALLCMNLRYRGDDGSRPFFDCRVESYSTSGFRSSIGRCGHSFKVCGYGAFAGV
jgi:O-succinylbenzoic acid--CoA ligase